MKNRLLILSAAVVAVGLFALPATVSMFAGQHSWYDPKDQGIPCEKCHWLEAQEMSALLGPHTGENTELGRMGCTYCHMAFEIGTGNIDPNFASYLNTSSKVHAGQTLPCLYCHSGADKGGVHTEVHDPDDPRYSGCDCHDYYTGPGCWDACHHADEPPPHGGRFGNDDCRRCHGDRVSGGFDFSGKYSPQYIPPAKGLGVTTNTSDTGERSAHTKFVLDARNNMTMLEDANEACLGCHTRTGVNITWTRNAYVSYHVTCDKSGYNVTWNTSNLGTNETMFDSSSGWDW